MTRLLVDLLFYTGARGGMESYVRNLYAHLARPDFEFVALASRELAQSGAPWFPGELVDSGVPGDHRAAWAWAELTAVGRAARRAEADLIHAPANVGPWRAPVPVVLTVHDLLPFRHPEFVPGRYSAVLRMLIRGAARNAASVLTISQQTATDLTAVLGLAPDSIDLTPLGAPAPLPLPHRERDPRLIFALGNRMPHKNFESLIRALALIPPGSRPRLVVSGSRGGDPLAAVVEKLGIGPWVDLRGWLDDEEIATLYATAAAVVIPSLFEGFGLPVLEGMARGCPVICSDLPVLHEVAGDAAVYFDPRALRSIADAISSTLADGDRLRSLGVAGRDRAGRFSWEQTAALTADAFQRALA